jgi:hypothetical protein
MSRGGGESTDLQSKRNATHWSLCNALHQVCDVAGNLVAHALGGNQSSLHRPCERPQWTMDHTGAHLIADLLVDLEVLGQARVVLLHNQLCGLLDRLSPDASLERENQQKANSQRRHSNIRSSHTTHNQPQAHTVHWRRLQQSARRESSASARPQHSQ